MKLYTCLVTAAIALSTYTLAWTQNTIPTDGEMIEINRDSLWKLTYKPNAQLSETTEISTGFTFHYPSISPNAQKILLTKPRTPAHPPKLFLWNGKLEQSPLLDNQNVSSFITWKSNASFEMRDPEHQFSQSGKATAYDFNNGKKLNLRSKIPYIQNTVSAYDDNDIITLVRHDTKTVQAISDLYSGKRYYAPIVSPDEKFVAFSCIGCGVHVFDTSKNAIVFIGLHGTDPRFSPDGRYLVYADTRDDGHNITQGDLVLIDLQNHAYQYLANPDREIRTNATLSSNANFVAYETSDGRILRARIQH